MKKVKFDKRFHLQIVSKDVRGSLLCPLSNTDKVEVVCGPWCAWFDIEDKQRPVSTTGMPLPKIVDIKVITCKGTPIGELVEEEAGE